MKRRYIELDILRSLAMLGMVIYHAGFILFFFRVADIDMSDDFWLILGNLVRYTFLILVGVSLAVSRQANSQNFIKRNFKRAAWIFTWAMIITLVTWLTVPHVFVRFGILHFIATGIFLCSFLARRKYLPLILALLSIPVNFFLKQQTTTSLVLFILGFEGRGINSLDHFPIFPWIALPLLGIFLGNMLYPRKTGPGKISQIQSGIGRIAPIMSKISLYISRNSLAIYLIHVPVLLAVFKIFGIMNS